MKITYTLSPGQDLKFYPISSRIISTNLLKSDIEEHFSPALLSAYFKSVADIPEVEKVIKEVNPNLSSINFE